MRRLNASRNWGLTCRGVVREGSDGSLPRLGSMRYHAGGPWGAGFSGRRLGNIVPDRCFSGARLAQPRRAADAEHASQQPARNLRLYLGFHGFTSVVKSGRATVLSRPRKDQQMEVPLGSRLTSNLRGRRLAVRFGMF